MIAHLRGVLLSKSPGSCIVECAGVGYEVAVSIPTFSALPEPGAHTQGRQAAPVLEVSLHIHTQVREDALALFGLSGAE